MGAQKFLAILAAAGVAQATSSIFPDVAYPRFWWPTSTSNLTSTNGTGSLEPCAKISRSYAAQAKVNPDATLRHYSSRDAVECLRSVPLDVKGNHQLIQDLKELWQFQSDLAWYKNPPAPMLDRKLDLIGDLDLLAKALDDGYYTNEYDFQFALWLLTNSAYDFHLVLYPDIYNIFTFTRGVYNTSGGFHLVSISEDGKKLPQIYDYVEVLNSANSTTKPVPITKIQGAPVEEFLDALTIYGDRNDIDARYNLLFPRQAFMASLGNQYSATFSANNFIEAEETIVEFADGTIKNLTNYAVSSQNFAGVVDGASFFKKFCNPESTVAKLRIRDMEADESDSPAASNVTTTVKQRGYPKPESITSSAILAGYFLSGEGYDDTAVISLNSFDPGENTTQLIEFQDVLLEFLDKADRANKDKLIIDLRANGGGKVMLGYEFFHQLFPILSLTKAITNIHEPEAIGLIAEVIHQSLANVTYDQAMAACNGNTTLDAAICNAWGSDFNYKSMLNGDGNNFASFKELAGPYVYNNDNFTSLLTFNWSDPLVYGNTPLTGYGDRNFFLPRHFHHTNITILQDGGCGSTCAIFSELMKTQAQVTQVVIGGRPHYGPMQGVSGAKGAQVLKLSEVQSLAIQAVGAAPELEDTVVGDIANITQVFNRVYYQDPDVAGTDSTGINWRNNIRPGDKTNTPLEFVYEAADCKLWYTAEMIRDVRNVWKATHDAAFNGWENCVQGSTGHPSSLTGGSHMGTSRNDTAATFRPGTHENFVSAGANVKVSNGWGVWVTASMMVGALALI